MRGEHARVAAANSFDSRGIDEDFGGGPRGRDERIEGSLHGWLEVWSSGETVDPASGRWVVDHLVHNLGDEVNARGFDDAFRV